jgi:uncharacterized membrane protein YjgN (DUF898 family)
MELLTHDIPAPAQVRSNTLQFTGKGRELLIIQLLNWVLTFVTLGLYYPWARVNKLKFLYGNMHLNGTPFIFHGTGKELFKGFIKFFVFILIWYGLIVYVGVKEGNVALFVKVILPVLSLVFLFIIPLALHGAFRYRLSRTSWRSIHLGYRGERGQLILEFMVGLALSVITFGVYYSWFMHKMRVYVIGNCRFGSLRMGYSGSGSELFIINLKAMIFIPFTFGLYYFWYRKEYLNYLADFTYIEQHGKKFHLKADIRGGSFFALSIINLFITLFTFGFGVPWVTVRTFNFMVNNISLPQQVDFDAIAQTEDEFTDATGEDVIDYVDLGII